MALRLYNTLTRQVETFVPTREGEARVYLCGMTPYDYAHPSWYARQGFVVVVQDTRGRWRSEGTWMPFFNETADGYDTVQWAAAQPWSKQRVSFRLPGTWHSRRRISN